MKHIIIEGLDRTGKDTLINYLCSTVSNYSVRHFKRPVGNTNEEKIQFQKNDFEDEFILSEYLSDDEISTLSPYDIYVWNRSHIGEYVYGNLYREYDPSWIFDLEKQHEIDKNDNAYLILLYADAEFLIKKEDGKSLSDKLEDREKEIKLFLEAFEKSNIKNKLKIKVNFGDNYIDKEYIQKQVTEFLNLM